MVPGTKMTGYFAFCDCRKFQDVLETLEEDVMVFTNTISGIIHAKVSVHMGQPNKNIGDSWLSVWSGKEEDVFVSEDGMTFADHALECGRLQHTAPLLNVDEPIDHQPVEPLTGHPADHRLRRALKALLQRRRRRVRVEFELRLEVFGEEIEDQITQLMRLLDVNNDGKLTYSEFLTAAINHRNLLSKENLMLAFKTIDINNDGLISI